MFQTNKRKVLEDLVGRLVTLEGFSDNEDIDRKIQFLCFALDQLKLERGILRKEVGFEEYVQGNTSISGGRICISAAHTAIDPGSGIGSIHLQAPLLLFLLLNHKERYQVLEIIKSFIQEIRSQLTLLDFKKTRTGVTRCFTNTRFAANVLRDYGLL